MDKDLRVWVVDDDQSVRWVLEKALRQADMQTRSFERGELLLDALESDEPDVLITDVRMPGMDGPGLYGEVALIAPETLGRFIFATGDLLNETAESFLTGAARPCLAKPF